MFRKIKYFIQQIKTIRRLNRMFYLDWHKSILFDKLKFYGHPTPQYLKRLHFLLKRDRISSKKMQILFDIESKYNQEISQTGVIVEVGAYIGYWAMKAAKKASKVYAIEAEPVNYELLKKNIEANKLTNIIPLKYAAWYKDDYLTMNVEGGQANSISDSINGNKIKVRCKRIDDTIKGKVDFVRIQVNGSELEVLQGMSELIKEYHPKIEIQTLFGKQKQIKLLLESHGYITIVNKTNIIAVKQ